MNDANTLLTVNVITYNHANFIGECLDSILSQKTTFGYIVRIFDDCSTDGTSEICKKYAENFPEKIKFYPHSKNNAVLNCKRSYENIETKYYMYIEGDDFCCDNSKFQLQVDFLENHPEYSFCSHNTKIIGARYKKMYMHKKGPFPSIEDLLMGVEDYWSPHISSKIVRSNCIDIDPVHPDVYMFDCNQTLSLLIKGKGYNINRVMTTYRVHNGGSFTKLNYREKIKRFAKASLEFNEYYDQKYDIIVYRNIAGMMFFYTGELFGDRREPKFFKHFKKVKSWKHYLIPFVVSDLINLPRDIKRYFFKKKDV